MDSDVDQYCLRWKYHHSNLQYMFAQLLENGSLCDVTLACEGKTIRVHKIMLSACSAYFDSIFSKYEENDPIVILDGIRFDDITALVEFMYRGEITVEKSRLNALIETAEELQVKGLAAVSWRSTNAGVDGDTNNDFNGQYSQYSGVKRKLSESSINDNYSDDSLRSDTVVPPQNVAKQKLLDSLTPKMTIPPPHCERDKSNVNNVNNIAVKKPKVAEVIPKVPLPKVINSLTSNKPSSPAKSLGPLTKENIVANTQPPPPSLVPVKEEALSDSETSDSSLPVISGVLSLSGREKGEELSFSNVVKMNDHIQQGGWRPHFWELESTKKVMDAIKNKKLEMKYAAELLGVTYGTLYGRYREVHGYLKQPQREFWHDVRFAEILGKLKRKEITLFTAADLMNISASVLANHLAKADKDPFETLLNQPLPFLDGLPCPKPLVKLIPTMKSPFPNSLLGETSFILPPLKIPEPIKLEPPSSLNIKQEPMTAEDESALLNDESCIIKKEPIDELSPKETGSPMGSSQNQFHDDFTSSDEDKSEDGILLEDNDAAPLRSPLEPENLSINAKSDKVDGDLSS